MHCRGSAGAGIRPTDNRRTTLRLGGGGEKHDAARRHSAAFKIDYPQAVQNGKTHLRCLTFVIKVD